MRIHQIEIKNFKGFAEESFNLNDHFTVFIGNNASGKTTVLDAISIALGAFLIEMEGINSRPIREDEVRIIQIDGQPKPQKPVVLTAKGTIDTQPISWKRGIFNEKTSSKYSNQIREIAKNKLAESREKSGIIFPVIAYHGTGRLWAEHGKVDFQKQEEGVKMAYKNCLSAKSSSKEFLEWYKTLENTVSKFQKPIQEDLLIAFKNTILALIPENRWEDMAYDFQLDELMGMFRGVDDKITYLSYGQLSDGYRNFIGMAADIAYRCVQLNPHLGRNAITDTPGVVLIDELDLHLHPNWQRHVIQDLKRAFPKVQFIATTHSPFIVQSLKSDELINLDRSVDSAPNDLSIHQVSELLMGVKGIFEGENSRLKDLSASILNRLDTEEDPSNIQEDINEVSNPAIRAFLELAKMAKGK